MSSGGKLARLKSAALKVAALINAVEKNSKFRQLASYSINVLTKAARAHESLDLRASNVVMAALAEHPQSLEMLSCASDCLAALAEDPRQAQAIAEGGGLTMGLTMALQLKDEDDDDGGGAAAGDPVAKALLQLKKVSTRAMFLAA